MDRITNGLPSAPARVLIIRLSALGDILHCLPALDAVQELWPAARCDWIVESLGASIIEGHPGLDRVIRLPRKEWQARCRRPADWSQIFGEFRRFRRELRQQRYDLILDFQGNLRSVAVVALARGRRWTSHHRSEVKDATGWLPARRPRTASGRVHRVEKNLHLVRQLGWEGESPSGRLPDYKSERDSLLAGGLGGLFRADDSRPVILHPFVSAFGRFKEWPAERFSALTRILGEQGIPSLITWAPVDRPAAEQIVEHSDGHAHLAPATSGLRELAGMLTLGRGLVAADTGVLHLGAFLGLPVVGLYGPKDPTIYGPWSQRGVAIRGDVPCAPCPLRRCDHAICMQSIKPAAVAEALLRIL